MLDVPDQVKPYFDYEAYGRDACIHENGHFAPGGYVVKESDHFVEVLSLIHILCVMMNMPIDGGLVLEIVEQTHHPGCHSLI